MTAAGVQTNDSAAYLPQPPSSSTPDSKGTSASGSQATDPQASDTEGTPSDFQSELALQQSSTQQAESKASPKEDVGKSGKKRNVRSEDTNPSAVTPVQVAESQKQILPLALALALPQESVPQQGNVLSDSKAKPDETELNALGPQLPQPAASKLSIKARSAAPAEIPLPVSQNIPVRPEENAPEDAASQDQAMAPRASSNSQAASPADLKLSATIAEPIASAVQEAMSSAPSSPSALAFAARISAAQQKTDQPVTGSSSQSSSPTPVPSAALSGSQTAVEIPMRYAATAQIIQSAAQVKQDESKKDIRDFIDGPAPAGARNGGARNDMVLPQFETVSQPATNSGSAAPQQTAPPAPAESVVEPPPAQPTSSHNLQFRVPDNNGGSTQLRFVESGGEVRVSVRTADEGLAQNLRTHLNDLTQRLSDGGMPAEMWKPAPNGASSQNDQQQTQQDGRGSGGQGSGGQSGQQDRQQKRPAWLDEMEASLHGEQN